MKHEILSLLEYEQLRNRFLHLEIILDVMKFNAFILKIRKQKHRERPASVSEPVQKV